ncbi:MAG: nucleotide exchange factor GrpE [Buchnera aphidicola (Pentalonia nigronervosa)]|uniref:Protein GrpE n=1 Tax=Buchnera aphidicola (Pentalonia nigronervosa) TaxID=1309793 RepID=A0A7H1AZP8_9GAMM|nr:MAG: nucleotide exchange factor GrpE [Buchnera aphidicola (Pentalonia nigronervosa)]
MTKKEKEKADNHVQNDQNKANVTTCIEKNDTEDNKLICNLKSQLHESQDEIIQQKLIAEEETLKTYNRVNKDVERYQKFSLEKIIINFLPIIDSIEHSLNLAKNDQLRDQYEIIVRKLEHVQDILQEVCKTFHISKINSVNVLFNPKIHQAMSVCYNINVQDNQVVSVMQPGYMLHESRLLRPAMVIVSKEKT